MRRRTVVIGWGPILYGAAITTAVVAVVFMIWRQRTADVLAPALLAAFLGPLAWNAVLHRVATETDGFFVDIPFKPFPVSWQDAGSGVVTLAVAFPLLGIALRREPAARVLELAATVASIAFLVDVYLY